MCIYWCILYVSDVDGISRYLQSIDMMDYWWWRWWLMMSIQFDMANNISAGLSCATLSKLYLTFSILPCWYSDAIPGDVWWWLCWRLTDKSPAGSDGRICGHSLVMMMVSSHSWWCWCLIRNVMWRPMWIFRYSVYVDDGDSLRVRLKCDDMIFFLCCLWAPCSFGSWYRCSYMTVAFLN